MEPGSKGNGEASRTSADAVWAAIEYDPRVAWRDCGQDRYLYRPGQLLVDAAYADRLAPFLREAGARPARLGCTEGKLLARLGLRRYQVVRPGREAPEVVASLRARLGDLDSEEQARAVGLNHVLAGAPFYKFGPADLPSDAGPAPVQPDPARKGGSGAGVRVAILDTGFVRSSLHHPLLAHDYQDDGDDGDHLYDEAHREILSVDGGHGTFVAGIVREQAPETILNPEVTLDDLLLTDDVEVAQDLLQLGSTDIVNLSLAGPSEGQSPPMALAKALRYLGTNSNAVFVAAAGNDYELAAEAGMPFQKMWPAAFGAMKGYEHVVGVAAVDRERNPAGFSNRGPWVRACSYGVDLRSTYVAGDMASPAGLLQFPNATATWSGTSFSTPRVAGIIAAAMTASTPPLSPRDALAQVLANAPLGPPDLGQFIG